MAAIIDVFLDILTIVLSIGFLGAWGYCTVYVFRLMKE